MIGKCVTKTIHFGRGITFVSCYANSNDEAGFLTQVAVIADLHLDPLPGGFKPDTRYIRASRA